jgi:hypothetical protein
MGSLRWSREIRTDFASVVADRDHMIELLADEFAHGFRASPGVIDSRFVENSLGQWIQDARRDPGRLRLDAGAAEMP